MVLLAFRSESMIFHGYLHTDAYAGYSQVDDVIHCCCMVHARRKFVEALPENIEHPDETIPGRVIKEMGCFLFVLVWA